MKILEIFGDNRREFIEKCRIIEIWWRISIAQLNLSKLPAKPFAFGPKMKRILKNSKKILSFSDQSLHGKLPFFTIFTKYLLDFWLRSESVDLWKIHQISTTIFPISGGGGTFRRSPPPPDATAKHIRFLSIFMKNCWTNFVCFSFCWKFTFLSKGLHFSRKLLSLFEAWFENSLKMHRDVKLAGQLDTLTHYFGFYIYGKYVWYW